MIQNFRHKGLQRFFLEGSKAGIQRNHADRLRLILANLNAATGPRDMGLPGLRLHPLKGERKGNWSVWVNGNWRVTFSFTRKNATDIDYEDYH